MALQYLRVYVDKDGRIAAVAERWLDERGTLKVHAAWDNKQAERGVVEDFLASSHFFSNKWTFVPVGVRVDEAIGHLWRRAHAYGHIAFGADPHKHKPRVDMSSVLILLNSDKRRPDGAYGDAPDCFYGADLGRFTFRNIDSESVAALVANREKRAAMAIIEAEHQAFMDLYGVLKDAMPALRESIIIPSFRGPAKPPPLDEQVL